MKPIWKGPPRICISQTCPFPPGNVVLADWKDLVHLPRISGHLNILNLCTDQLQCSMKHQSQRAWAAERVCAGTWKPAKHSSRGVWARGHVHWPVPVHIVLAREPPIWNSQLSSQVNLVKRSFDGLTGGISEAALQAERAGMERTAGDNMQQAGWVQVRMSAAALFAPVLQDRGREPWVLHSTMDIKCHRTSFWNPADHSGHHHGHHRATFHFFFCLSFPMKSVSVCAYKAQHKTIIYAPPRTVRRILPPSGMKVAQYFYPGGAHVFKYLLLSSPYWSVAHSILEHILSK